MDGQVQTMLKAPAGHQIGGETEFHDPSFGHPDVSHVDFGRIWQPRARMCHFRLGLKLE